MLFEIKTIYRNFTRKTTVNLINLAGLSVSLALVIVLSIYSYSELTTDYFHKNGDRVYLFSDSKNLPRIYTPAILKDKIDLNIPEVESTVRLAGTWDPPVFQVVGKEPVTSDLVFADKDFFKLFSFTVLQGNVESALNEPLTVIITKSLAQKLFGNTNVVNKTFRLNKDKWLTVKAVIDEPVSNSCLSFSALTSIETRKIVMPNEGEFNSWDFCLFQTFVLLKTGANPQEITDKISAFFPKEMKRNLSAATLTPLKKLYFTDLSLFNGNYLHNGDLNKIKILLMVAFLVLLIALINFVNITSAQWYEKIKQTGVMKMLGANRKSIILNILSEAFLFFFLALLLAFLLTILVFPAIENYTGISLNTELIFSPLYLFSYVAVISFISMIFSLVPAIKISSSKAIDNLKNIAGTQPKNSITKGLLVSFQFCIAMVLIAFTILVQKQVNFGNNNLGFQTKNTIGIKLTPELFDKKDVLKKTLLENAAVKNISFTQFYPGAIVSHWDTQTIENGENKKISYDLFGADPAFFTTMNINLIQGRFYSEDFSSDGNKVVVNETFIKENKILNPIGIKFLNAYGSECEVVGVIKDFRYKAVNSPVLPLVIQNFPYAAYCLVNFRATDFNSLKKNVENVKLTAIKLSPSFPVEISFLDQAVENMYSSEQQFRTTFSLFSSCAIVLCCLGILAMSLSACQHRTKEIGIRKVNGAKTLQVLVLLNFDLLKLLGSAFVISTPIAWYIMHKWLENYAYKTELSWWIFALAGLLALVIALLTVSWQSWRAATRNPVEALRYE
ncbi:MAG: FtsX-like permease family protein [Bacteroidales bacterium]